MIIRRRHNGNFTVIGNAPMDDKALAAEALGVLCYLRSRPDNWTVLPRQLQDRFGCGRDRIYRILKELIQAGYIIRRQLRGADSTWKSLEYLVLDEPNQPFPEKPDAENANALIRTNRKQSVPASAAINRSQDIDPSLAEHVLEAIENNGGRMHIGGVIKDLEIHGITTDGAFIGRMVATGHLLRDGQYVALPEQRAAA